MRLSVICGFPPKRIPQENGTSLLLPVLVSRYVLGRVLPDQDHGGPAAGQLASPAAELGRVPRRLIWDNERGIGRGRTRSDGVPAFLATMAPRLVRPPPRDPESKGVVERRSGWFETSFMPGRSFASPQGFNDQFTD